MKKLIAITLLAIVSTGILFNTLIAADTAMHKVAIHVDENDPARMNMALDNVANMNKYYESIGESVEIELVAYGPGSSPVKDRISVMSLEIENLTFSACGNTHNAMQKKAGEDIVLIDEANLVPSGVVQLVDLQEKGYAYIRP